MMCVIQRVSSASVLVENQIVGRISRGLCVLAAVHRADDDSDVAWTARKLVALRLFPEADQNFHLDVAQVGGEILLISNFTVAADARTGRRPSLGNAADPQRGRELFDKLIQAVRATGVKTETGVFGADMQVSLTNDGPITIILDSRDQKSA